MYIVYVYESTYFPQALIFLQLGVIIHSIMAHFQSDRPWIQTLVMIEKFELAA